MNAMLNLPLLSLVGPRSVSCLSDVDSPSSYPS
jgi:hypothetical protein